MIEPFCSEYIKSYRAHDREPELEGSKPCLYYSELRENFLPTEDSKTIYNSERDETVIKDLYLKRYITTYQSGYCHTVGKKSLVIDPNDLEADQFVMYFNKYYSKKTQPVPRPLDTSRRLFGYTRFSNYYVGKTEYDDTIGRVAYNYFKKEFDSGKSRLFGKKQEALKKLKETPEPDEVKLQRVERNSGTREAGVDERKNENLISDGDGQGDNDNGKKSSKEKICFLCCREIGNASSSGPSTEAVVQ